MDISEVNRALDKIFKMSEHAIAHILLSSRGQEAQDYCQKYIPLGLGEITWHLILDDAIRMRAELAKKS